MTHHFSDIDRRLLSYLQAKGRFTTRDSIMAGRRSAKSVRPDLGDSWADVSSEDELSEGGESLDIHTTDDERHLPTSRIEEDARGGAKAVSSSQRSLRASQQSVKPQSPSKSATLSSSQRTSSRLERSVEPEFIMPSMMTSGSLKGSPKSPLSSNVRARKARLSTSRATPSRDVRNTPKKDDSPKSRKPTRKAHARQGSPITAIWTNLVQPVVSYTLGVIGYAMLHLKPIFGALLAIVVLFYGFKLAFQSTFGALQILPDITKIIPSPCSVPVLNMLPMCGKSSFAPGGNPEFGDLMELQSSFEEILQNTAQGSQLPIEMKQSEASVRDLKYVVMYSNLPSKNELVYEFEGFIDLAKQASGDLIKFNSKVGRAVDIIINTNKFTLQAIDGFVETEASRGALSKLFWGSQGLTQSHLLQQYLAHANKVEEEIQRLIKEAQVLLNILEGLDQRLEVIQDLVTNNGVKVSQSRDELFAQLWTKLGGNRNNVAKLNQQMQLLKSVNTYRKAAWTHVTSTLLKLREISAGLDDLRERIALPDTVGVEVVPLQQHIETIQMGVERLERVRDSARKMVSEGQRRILDGEPAGVGKDRMVDGRVNVGP